MATLLLAIIQLAVEREGLGNDSESFLLEQIVDLCAKAKKGSEDQNPPHPLCPELANRITHNGGCYE